MVDEEEEGEAGVEAGGAEEEVRGDRPSLLSKVS